MKFKAFILSLCLVVYLVELVALPVNVARAPAKSTCCGKMGMAMHHPCKKQQKDCNTTNCCVNCPLCYSFTSPVMAGVRKLSGLEKKEYASFQSNYLFTYASECWKPPNA